MKAALSLVACAGLLPFAASSQDNAQASFNAYGFAVRCFTANSVATGDRRYNPDGQNDAALKASAYRAYNAAQVMGTRLGYSKKRISDDIIQAGNVEGTLMLRNDAYFQRARADCVKLGML